MEGNLIKTDFFIVNKKARSAYPVAHLSHYSVSISITYSKTVQGQQINKALECLRTAGRM